LIPNELGRTLAAGKSMYQFGIPLAHPHIEFTLVNPGRIGNACVKLGVQTQDPTLEGEGPFPLFLLSRLFLIPEPFLPSNHPSRASVPLDFEKHAR
jgi:hypothetical protein